MLVRARAKGGYRRHTDIGGHRARAREVRSWDAIATRGSSAPGILRVLASRWLYGTARQVTFQRSLLSAAAHINAVTAFAWHSGSSATSPGHACGAV